MSPDPRSVACDVSDTTQVGEARRAAAQLAKDHGLSEAAAGKAGVILTELATNLVKHAGGGHILLRRLGHGRRAGMEILAVDNGPGMGDVAACFRDGYSTAGTPGTGLGSVARLADRWDIYSAAGAGTVIVAQVGKEEGEAGQLETGAICIPMKGEVECGDAWAHLWNPTRERVVLADGLGHGPQAAEAAAEAARIFREKEGHALPDVMQGMHNGLKKTRGAAVALAEIDLERGLVRFVSVGNVAGVIVQNAKTRSMVSANGTVGHELRKVQEFQYPWPPDALLVMSSDGLSNRWEFGRYPGLGMRRPSVIAGVLWRDHTRGRDDATIFVARKRPAKS